jgi:hypothetical protein
LQMHPLHGEIFEGKLLIKKNIKKKLENWDGKSLIVVSLFVNSGFSILFLVPWIFFSFFFTMLKFRSSRPPTWPLSFWLVKGTEMRLKKGLLKTVRCNKYGLNWFYMTCKE